MKFTNKPCPQWFKENNGKCNNHRNEALEYLYEIKHPAQAREKNQKAKNGTNAGSSINKGPIRQCRKLKTVMHKIYDCFKKFALSITEYNRKNKPYLNINRTEFEENEEFIILYYVGNIPLFTC